MEKMDSRLSRSKNVWVCAAACIADTVSPVLDVGGAAVALVASNASH